MKYCSNPKAHKYGVLQTAYVVSNVPYLPPLTWWSVAVFPMYIISYVKLFFLVRNHLTMPMQYSDVKELDSEQEKCHRTCAGRDGPGNQFCCTQMEAQLEDLYCVLAVSADTNHDN